MSEPWGYLQEFPVDLYEDIGQGPLEDMVREGLQRVATHDHVRLITDPQLEWALLPATSWDDPETGETIEISERWACRAIAAAERV